MKLALLAWHALPLAAYVWIGNPKIIVGWFILQTGLTIIFVAFAKETIIHTKRIG